jgi:hypothetical protein
MWQIALTFCFQIQLAPLQLGGYITRVGCVLRAPLRIVAAAKGSTHEADLGFTLVHFSAQPGPLLFTNATASVHIISHSLN